MKNENNIKGIDKYDDNRYEQAESLGIPKEELTATKTSLKGRYVDIPVEHAGYPSEYDKRLEIRKGNYEEAEQAASIENQESI